MKKLQYFSYALLFGFLVSSNVYAKDVRVAFGVSIPPYVLPDENRGIEYDIIKEALAHKGHEIVPVYMPFVEITDAFIENRADAIATTHKSSGIEGYYSDISVVYHNYAISRADHALQIESVADLADKKIVAFQLATNFMGVEFSEMASNNPQYREKASQATQVSLLFKDKVDVIISDDNIFKFFRKQVAKTVDTSPEVVYHNIFPENEYSVVFKDVGTREDFNAGLKYLRDTDRYQKIIDSYIK